MYKIIDHKFKYIKTNSRKKNVIEYVINKYLNNIFFYMPNVQR